MICVEYVVSISNFTATQAFPGNILPLLSLQIRSDKATQTFLTHFVFHSVLLLVSVLSASQQHTYLKVVMLRRALLPSCVFLGSTATQTLLRGGRGGEGHIILFCCVALYRITLVCFLRCSNTLFIYSMRSPCVALRCVVMF